MRFHVLTDDETLDACETLADLIREHIKVQGMGEDRCLIFDAEAALQAALEALTPCVVDSLLDTYSFELEYAIGIGEFLKDFKQADYRRKWKRHKKAV